jgi:hypothetical protein
MNLTPALDLQKIEGMKKGIPDINVFSESTAKGRWKKSRRRLFRDSGGP